MDEMWGVELEIGNLRLISHPGVGRIKGLDYCPGCFFPVGDEIVCV